MAATRTRDVGHEEALLRIVEELGERVQLLEVALGQVAASLHGISGSGRVSATMPELAELLRRHEISGRYPNPRAEYGNR
jgi:hypothetical protein